MILNVQEIQRRMSLPFPDKLVITPILSGEQMKPGNTGVDIRLGQDFIVAEGTALANINPMELTDRQQLAGYLRRVHVPIGDAFVLHPRQFALGATLEYFKLPANTAADVIGRSRWARVGLVIAMATFVRPGYAGCLTLELQNLGDVPLNLSPGLSIAQVILADSMSPDPTSPSQFQCSVGPEFPELVGGSDLKALTRFRTERQAHLSKATSTK